MFSFAFREHRIDINFILTLPHVLNEVNDLELCIAIFVGFYQSLISFLLINCNQVCFFFKFWWHSRKVLNNTIFIIFWKKHVFVCLYFFHLIPHHQDQGSLTIISLCTQRTQHVVLKQSLFYYAKSNKGNWFLQANIYKAARPH